MDTAREREEALTKNDMFWQKRINQIEVANSRSAQIQEKEYNQSVGLPVFAAQIQFVFPDTSKWAFS